MRRVSPVACCTPLVWLLQQTEGGRAGLSGRKRADGAQRALIALSVRDIYPCVFMCISESGDKPKRSERDDPRAVMSSLWREHESERRHGLHGAEL
ncbi:hypothetical protein EYF80_030165 [Liparis tanakae]|uniref:Uncharacterized protein n=1 Tax=Liparis tanakae TaxID=230148 RepID=A0A4Z2H3D0_9TELE|nr:hypothetical protein EYF80_030165 [Liparis tanakae]